MKEEEAKSQVARNYERAVKRAKETTEEDLMNTVFPHPTLSEMMHEAVLDAYGRAIHF